MPTILFTSRGIDALRASDGKRIDYFDEKVTGLGLRVSPSGRKTWFLFYRSRSVSKRYIIGTYPIFLLADAREKALKLLLEIANGQDPADTKRAYREAMTVKELANLYIEKHSKPNKRSWKRDVAYSKDVIEAIGNLKCCDVRRRDISAMLDGILPRGQTIANHVFKFTRSMFNFAVTKEIVEISPCYKLKAPGKEKSRKRVLTNDEIAALWRSIEAEELVSKRKYRYLISAYFKLLILLGQRGYEVRTMRWNDIELESGWWTIPEERSKNKKPHRVPLGPLSLQILLGLKATSKSEWVFPSVRRQKAAAENKSGHLTSIGKATERIRKRIQIDDFRNHDYRRTTATYLAELGIAESIIERVLNHSEPEKKVTQRYNRYAYDKEKKAALALWEEHVTKIVSSEAAGTQKSEAKALPSSEDLQIPTSSTELQAPPAS